VAIWSEDAQRDLDGIWAHQRLYNGIEAAYDKIEWLLELADTIVPARCPFSPIPGARKFVKDGYVFLVRASGPDVQVIGVFGPGQNWTVWAAER